MTKRCHFFFAGIAFSPNHSTKHWFYALATGVGEGWTSLPMPELLTIDSCRKHWKRISAESFTMSPWWPVGQGTELNWYSLWRTLYWDISHGRSLYSCYITGLPVSCNISPVSCNISNIWSVASYLYPPLPIHVGLGMGCALESLCPSVCVSDFVPAISPAPLYHF